MKFSQWLNENYRPKRPIRLILNGSPVSAMLPITPKQFENITDKGTTAFHITSPNNVTTLKRLEGKKKTISVLTGLKDDYYIYSTDGIASGRGLAKLKGDAVVKFSDDIYSEVDKQGRRWIPVKLNSMTNSETYTFKKIFKLKEDIFTKHYGAKFGDILFDNLKLDEQNDKKKLNKIVTEYMDGVNKILKDKKVTEFLTDYTSPSRSSQDYDEILFNNFKIEKYWMIENLPLDKSQLEMKSKIEKMGIDVEVVDVNKDSNIDKLMKMINKEGGKK